MYHSGLSGYFESPCRPGSPNVQSIDQCLERQISAQGTALLYSVMHSTDSNMWVLNLSVVRGEGREGPGLSILWPSSHHLSVFAPPWSLVTGHPTLRISSEISARSSRSQDQASFTAQFLILMSEIIASNSIKCKHYQSSLITLLWVCSALSGVLNMLGSCCMNPTQLPP